MKLKVIGRVIGRKEAEKKEKALYLLGPWGVKRFDTVGVWGSNPHAPTNPFNNLPLIPKFPAAPKRPIQTHHS
jgi:hypothetical protein